MVIRSDLSCSGKPGDEAGFLAIDQRVSAAVPRSSLSLNEAEQVDEQCNLTHVMDNVLKPRSNSFLPTGFDPFRRVQQRLIQGMDDFLVHKRGHETSAKAITYRCPHISNSPMALKTDQSIDFNVLQLLYLQYGHLLSEPPIFKAAQFCWRLARNLLMASSLCTLLSAQ